MRCKQHRQLVMLLQGNHPRPPPSPLGMASVASIAIQCKHFWAAVLIFIFPTLCSIYSHTHTHLHPHTHTYTRTIHLFKIPSVSIHRAIYQSLRTPNYKKMKALLEVPLPDPRWRCSPPTRNTLAGFFACLLSVLWSLFFLLLLLLLFLLTVAT